MRRIAGVALALGLWAAPAGAQETGAAAHCPGVPAGEPRDLCFTVAQALESAQPQVGILLAGGNPTLGTASTGGIRLGVLPRVSATAKANLVFIRLPDVLAEGAGETARRFNEVAGIPAPALSGTVTVGLYPGVSLAPTIGGVGAIDLLASATWLPFETLGVEGFEEGNSGTAWGVGARVGILRESFTTPGASVSLMYRRLDDVRFGEVCPGGEVPTAPPGGTCPVEGDAGEVAFDLTDWSARAALSKRLFGWGLTAGVGYDRFASDAAFAFRIPDPTVPAVTRVFRSPEVEVDNDRWSAFANASFTALFASLALEAGWLQGAEPITGFPQASDFDPSSGTFWGSIGFRLAL